MLPSLPANKKVFRCQTGEGDRRRCPTAIPSCSKYPAWPVTTIGSDGELWAWLGQYDTFLGYMAGVLELLAAGPKGFEPL